jgi:hypothetical protein
MPAAMGRVSRRLQLALASALMGMQRGQRQMAERSGVFLLQGGDSLVAMETGQFASEDDFQRLPADEPGPTHAGRLDRVRAGNLAQSDSAVELWNGIDEIRRPRVAIFSSRSLLAIA